MAKRSGVMAWANKHPWMTFFIVTGAISAVVELVRGRQPIPPGFDAGADPGQSRLPPQGVTD